MKPFTPDPAAVERWLEWYRAAQSGSEPARERLLAELRPCLLELVQVHLRGQAFGAWDHSDIAQDCCVKLFALPAEQGFRGTTGPEFIAWLRAIAQHQSLDRIRMDNAQKRGGGQGVMPLPADTSCGPGGIAADASTPSMKMARQEEHDRLGASIEQLSSDDQQVIRLRIFEKLTYAEIAQRLGRTEEAVKQLFHRALKRLRKMREDQA